MGGLGDAGLFLPVKDWRGGPGYVRLWRHAAEMQQARFPLRVLPCYPSESAMLNDDRYPAGAAAAGVRRGPRSARPARGARSAAARGRFAADCTIIASAMID